MTPIIAWTLILIFSALALLHVYWALGNGGTNALTGTIPERAGKPLFKPGRGITLIVALGLFGFALTVFGILGYLPFVPSWLFRLGVSGIALLFFLRALGDFRYLGFTKTIRNTPFARNDTRYYAPLCLVLALSAAFLALYA